QYRFSGKQKMLELGGYPMVSLAEPRKSRDAAKKLVSEGIRSLSKEQRGQD
ncbi:Arm DNA-binding domain-containing protein, partial [Salmonella enterica subsp. enterica serovar Infantis]